MRQGLLVYNPFAGRARPSPARLGEVAARLHEHGWQVEPFESRREGQVLPLEGRQLLIVYGGDGTIHDILGSALCARIPIGIIPCGTANVLARELGIPLDYRRAVEVIGRGRRRAIHIGRADRRPFHLMGGVGPDAYLNQRVSPVLKRKLGVGAYWLTGMLGFWGYRLEPFRVTIEGGETQEATFAVVSNSRYYGGRLLVTPRAGLAEDVLDVCLFTSTSQRRYLRYLLGVLKGRHLSYDDVIYRKARRVEIDGPPHIPVQLDGETRGRLPIKFSMEGETVEVMV